MGSEWSDKILAVLILDDSSNALDFVGYQNSDYSGSAVCEEEAFQGLMLW